MPVLGVIPARIGSTRLPHKPLASLAGVPLVVRVYQRARSFGLFDDLVVATDAAEIAAVVAEHGGTAVLTSPDHGSGTERVAEVAERPDFAPFDVVVNVQGDEPFLRSDAVKGAIDRIRAGDDVGTAAAPLDPADVSDPGRVKVICDRHGRALYFSRAAIPFVRDATGSATYWQHLGIYAYTRPALARWVRWPAVDIERSECLEQLRALWYGLTIGVALVSKAAPAGIDTPEDLAHAERMYHDFQRETS